MSPLEMFLASIGLNKVSALTGFLGSFVAALKGDANPLVRVLNFIAGFCFAAWGSTVAVALFRLPSDPPFIGAFGFALGFVGMAILDAMLVAASQLKAIDWKSVFLKALAKVGL